MQKILIPLTSLEVSRVSFGTASLHHLFSEKERRVLLSAALDGGISHFDTAPMYGEGIAERTLGGFLGASRSNVSIATKIGYPSVGWAKGFPSLFYLHKATSPVGRMIFGEAWARRKRALAVVDVERTVRDSCHALRTDWLDLLLIHEPKSHEIDDISRLVEWLHRQKQSGRVRHVGLAGNAAECLSISEALPGMFDVLQVEDSLDIGEADALIRRGHPLQFTFGYLRRGRGNGERAGADLIRDALLKNRSSSIIVSSRDPRRVMQMCRFVSGFGGSND